MPGRVLVVDAEPLKRMALQVELTEHGYDVIEAADGRSAQRLFDLHAPDVVVSDQQLPDISGLELLTHIKSMRAETPVIMMSAYATCESAVIAVKRGAHDYLKKPFTTQELVLRLERLTASGIGRPPGPVVSLGRAIARSAGMAAVFEQLRAFASAARGVTITGESGVGKRLLTECLHETSPLAERPLSVLSPLELEEEPENGAHAPRVTADVCADAVERALGGALLLSDADQLSTASQDLLVAHLHKAMSSRSAPLLLATARIDPTHLASAGRFKPQLAEWLGRAVVLIPPLRERPSDIPPLANCFIERHAALAGGQRVSMTKATVEELVRYDWPGNARELETVIQHALSLCRGQDIRPEHVLPLATRDEDGALTLLEAAESGSFGLNETIADVERRLIVLALRQCQGNQARAAQRLKIPRTTLRDKMARYSIPTA